MILALLMDHLRDHKLARQCGFSQRNDQIICWFKSKTNLELASDHQLYLTALLQHSFSQGGYLVEISQLQVIGKTSLITFKVCKQRV